MCQSTRYLAAYPLRTVTAKSVIKALSQFISVFGIPKIIQTDQRSNFTSRLFAQVLQHPQVKHNMASAYHPHGQGALERFHQHLKSLLCAYWTELKADWEDGLPWLLLAIEKLSKKIWDLVPMNLLLRTLSVVHDQWMLPDRPQNFITYVNDFSGCVLFFSRTYRLTFDSTDELAADFI